jgi:hypothetical protein
VVIIEQSVLLPIGTKPFAHRVKETACVAFTLEADDEALVATRAETYSVTDGGVL